ncbi:MAG: 16S rRNA (cytosine(1402)-N(4))-methyltransferase RsmH [Pseudomonadota bacterium]
MVTPESDDRPHIPVMLDEVCQALCPVRNKIVVDGTFGAGGYSRAFLKKHAAQVIAIDRDPTALAAARTWSDAYPALSLVEGVYGELDTIARDHANGPIDAVVLDIGVSSMQLDQGERGFSFLRDGPLDMRMSNEGASAADLVNEAEEAVLADIFYHYGEDRASRRIARAVVRERDREDITSTLRLAQIVSDVLPRPRPGQAHPATRVFQALRIAVNDELGELVRGLAAAEQVLATGGRLAVVTFHSLEDRIVKRYLQMASATSGGGSRHGPSQQVPEPRYERPPKAQEAGAVELARNPRARSARLRHAVRTDAAPLPFNAKAVGLPVIPALSRKSGGR